MKKLILSITLLFFGMYLQAQVKCNDVIHPTDNKESILNCCIKDVKPGNIVVYSIGDITYETEAVAIDYRGEYVYLIDYKGTIANKIREDNYQGILYHGHNDEHYQKLYTKANTQIVMGALLPIVGIGMIVGGTRIVRDNYEKWGGADPTEKDSYGNGAGIALLLAGAAACAGGTLIVIKGIKKRKYSKKALDEFNKINLSMGITNNGIGLVLNF